MIKKIVATHNKLFHADEVTAIALLEIFMDFEIIVKRINHDTQDFLEYDFVIDIGKKFDGIKYFDHHQFKGGKSSAGLIWDYIGQSKKYPKISKLIELVDKNDVGIEKSKEFEYSSLIKCYNSKDLISQNQDIQFMKAIDFAKTVLLSMKEMDEEIIKAKQIIANSFNFYNNPEILELSEFTPYWTTYINGTIMPHIKAVVWEDKLDNTWKVRIPPLKLGSFDLNGKKLKADTTMDFIHNSGHFAIARNETIMKKYLDKSI